MDIYQDRIRPLFTNSGLQDKEIEALFDLPRGVIYKWGTGKYKSYQKYIPQIAAYFHVSTDYLLGNTDDPQPVRKEENPITQTSDGLTDEQRIAIEKIKSMSPEELAKKMAALNAVLDM